MKNHKVENSKFYIVSTPIGNKSDITLRAIETLKKSDFILCEDINRSKSFLKGLEVSVTNKKFQKIGKFNEKKTLATVIEFINKERCVSLISDAGTPLISDPGQFLVRDLINMGIIPVVIPGPSSITASIVLSGEVFKSFSFLGFISSSLESIKKQVISNSTDILVFFESPHRINKTIENLKKILPNSNLVIVKEITKIFEKRIPNKIKDIDAIENPKGEFVLLLSNYKIDKTILVKKCVLEDLKISERIDRKQTKNLFKFFKATSSIEAD